MLWVSWVGEWRWVVGGVVDGAGVGAVVVWRRLGLLTIILSICLCVRRSLLASSVVSVHDALPYKTVGVMVP